MGTLAIALTVAAGAGIALATKLGAPAGIVGIVLGGAAALTAIKANKGNLGGGYAGALATVFFALTIASDIAK